MKLSVIIPSLDGTVPSIASHPQVELVVVKGVSPVSAARNEGLRRSTGDYVAWVDADDEVLPEWTESILAGITPQQGQPAVDVLSFNARVEWWDGSGRRPYAIGGVARWQDVLSERSAGQLWNKVFRRSLFSGLAFRDEAAPHEDYCMMSELLPRAKTVVHLDKTLYVYKRRADGLSQYANADGVERAIRYLIGRCQGESDEIRREMTKGMVMRAADFCRNARSVPVFRRFIRTHLTRVLTDSRVSFRVKIKCLFAGFGL